MLIANLLLTKFMAGSFITFQTFADAELAQQTADYLKENGIESDIENNRTFYDPSYANNSFGSDIYLKISADDFVKARQVLEKFYEQELDSIDENYHLFQFTDAELIEIVNRPDEWGFLDYQLAQRILKERGRKITPELISQLKENRNKQLEKPETASEYWIYAGYVFALVGGLLGLIIAWPLAYLKKTLPDGRRIFVYREADRDQGTRIMLVSAISVIFWLVVRWYFAE